MRVLILDDDLKRHDLFKRKLIGLVVVSVETVEQCLSELKNNDPFDFILLDHDLGGEVYVPSGPGTGYEVAEWLRDHPEKMPKKVILHTCNKEGAEKMLEVIPNAIYLKALFYSETLDKSYLLNFIT